MSELPYQFSFISHPSQQQFTDWQASTPPIPCGSDKNSKQTHPLPMGFNHFKQNDKEEEKGLEVLVPEVQTA